MIFVTIGSVFPFDRLVRMADAIAPSFPEERFFAQIGDGAYRPRRLEFVRWLTTPEFAAKVAGASVMIAHAGMGSVITAMERGKPIVLVPRRQEWGEHNTDHQMATARWLSGRSGVYVCMDDQRFEQIVAAAIAHAGDAAMARPAAPEPLVRHIRSFITEVRRPGH